MSIIKLEKSTHTLLDNGIIHVIISDNVVIEVVDMIAIKEANLKLSKGRKYLVYVNPGMSSMVTPKARELTSSKEHSAHRLAQAFIARNLAQRIVGNFYLKVRKHDHPKQMFMKEDEALK